MKKKLLFLFPIAVIPSLLCTLGRETFQVASAYNISKLPTTINLKDNTADEIRNYYSSLNSLSDEERQGTNLLKNLKPILKANQKYYSYDSGNAIWQIYEIADRDWAKSPASSTTQGEYSASTNTIINYKYGTGKTDAKNNPYIRALYVNRNVDNNVHAWTNDNGESASHGDNKPWNIDREHIWQKSAGFEDSGAGGARGDPMHLWAGDSYVNSSFHSNYYYGYVDKTKTYKDAGTDSKYSYLAGNLMGYSKTLGGETNVFEPQDSDKGDIARALFYMMARYNYLSGNDSDGIDSNNPNLELVNDLTTYAKKGYMSTTTITGKNGIIQDLLMWNKIDPVDEYEIHRNNLLFNNYTNNRNPFIDFPQWADCIWGTVDNQGHYNPSPRGQAHPNSDSINDSGFTISASSISLKEGETKTISATTENNTSITWSLSSNDFISLSKTTSASGEEITITAIKGGKTTITAKAIVGGQEVTKECVVNVQAPISPILIIVAVIVVIGAIIIIAVVSAKNKKLGKKIGKKATNYAKTYLTGSSSSGKKKSPSKKSSSTKKK